MENDLNAMFNGYVSKEHPVLTCHRNELSSKQFFSYFALLLALWRLHNGNVSWREFLLCLLKVRLEERSALSRANFQVTYFLTLH